LPYRLAISHKFQARIFAETVSYVNNIRGLPRLWSRYEIRVQTWKWE
jgi:hypothetical protein